jgi:hypothetical protein
MTAVLSDEFIHAKGFLALNIKYDLKYLATI